MSAAIRIVLVSPSHPGNIGAVARAMKTMGLYDLALVTPRRFPHAEATAMAAGADDLLAGARVCATLDEALAGCRLVIGSSARSRSIRWPQLDTREAARQLVAAREEGPAALLFGPERTGLSNDDLDRCHALVSIPANPDYGSLNLGSAVQVLTYEIRMAVLAQAADGEPDGVAEAQTGRQRLATADEVEGFFSHLERTLHQVDFIDPARPGRVLRRMRRLFARARPEEDEIQILRGILTQVDKAVARGTDATDHEQE
jgi:tRNA/rRNA methyltransferase/tRNA (cytidine32/uridine32-2'-O)-methyltransferase